MKCMCIECVTERGDENQPDRQQCPKCKYWSGDDWKQCNGVCPMPGSPHYDMPVQHEYTMKGPYDK